MQKLEIKGGRKISGTVLISGSKNATLPILASTILTNKKIVITNVPIVRDVETMAHLLSTIGSTIEINKRTKKIKILKVISNTKNTLKSKKISDFLSDDQILFKITGADSMNYILLATNRIDIVIEDGLKNIDILPLMNFLQINNVDFINWDNNKQIFKSNNSLIFFKKNKKNTIFVKKFLNLFKS